MTEEEIGIVYRRWDETPGASHADLIRAVEQWHGIGGEHE